MAKRKCSICSKALQSEEKKFCSSCYKRDLSSEEMTRGFLQASLAKFHAAYPEIYSVGTFVPISTVYDGVPGRDSTWFERFCYLRRRKREELDRPAREKRLKEKAFLFSYRYGSGVPFDPKEFKGE